MPLAHLDKVIADRFGGRRGLASYCLGQLVWYCGGFRRRRRIDWARVDRLVFICAGNICRSPLGEAVAREAGFNTASFGLSCTTGVDADPRAQAFAAANGLDLVPHRAQLIDDFAFAAGDLLIGMEPAHLRRLPPSLAAHQQTLLGLWDRRPFVHLHDPYSASPAYFERCEQAVVRCTRALCNAAQESPAAVTAAAGGEHA